jgi:Coenzyme PQQ synthesis protein D (PqqD)
VDLQSLIARNEELLSAPVDRDLVFLNTASNSYVALDEIGRRVWELLEHPRRIADLIGELSKEFEGSPDAIGADVQAFLQELEREGMVRVVDERPA